MRALRVQCSPCSGHRGLRMESWMEKLQLWLRKTFLRKRSLCFIRRIYRSKAKYIITFLRESAWHLNTLATYSFRPEA
jgi:hypothetical protein